MDTARTEAVAEGLFRDSCTVMRLRELYMVTGTPTGDQPTNNTGIQ